MLRRMVFVALALAMALAVPLVAQAATVPGTPISNILTTSTTALAQPITVKWAPKPPAQVIVGGKFQAGVNMTSTADMDRVLVIVEIKKADGSDATPADFEAVAEDGQPLGYDEKGGFWYWGPRSGFSVPKGYDVTTVFSCML